MQIGTVRELWRYPVKSMQGERCPSLRLGPRGLEGDRRYAVVDRTSGRTLTAKTVPELLFASARTHGEVVTVELPDGRQLDAGDPATSVAVAAWLGRDCELVGAEHSIGASYDMTFDPESDEAELVNIPVATGTFFDLTPLHVLSTTSLATMGAAHPGGDWDVRRFRPNVLVAPTTVTGIDSLEVLSTLVPPGQEHPAFPEDGWVGRTVRIGESGAFFEVLMPAVRCAMPNRAQPGLERDLDIYRTMERLHSNHLGLYAAPAGEGLLREGDQLHLQE